MIEFWMVGYALLVYLLGVVVFQIFWALNIDKNDTFVGFWWPIIAPFMLCYWLVLQPGRLANYIATKLSKEGNT
jgi:hypothetical protein